MKIIDTNIYVIYYTLFDIIDNKYPLWNHKNVSGYLINKNDYYIFQLTQIRIVLYPYIIVLRWFKQVLLNI